MLLVGIPYSEPGLNATQTGGTPYGASHVARTQNDTQLSSEEIACAQTLGRRVAQTAKRLGNA
jgi:NAD(P)H dehydrogenase (quinone)